jgi:SAM-dependent methyltransferase
VRGGSGLLASRKEVWLVAARRAELPAYDRALVSEHPDRYEKTLRGFGLGGEDLTAWHESGLPEDAFEDWLTDRVARRPSGSRARRVYGAEDVHDFARCAILEALALGASDRLVEIGCGGGLLLRDALRTGCRATGLDHSDEMVGLARERAPGAEVVVAQAERLPFAGDTFSAVAMSVVFFFLDDPLAVLRECRRVLRPGGRLAVYTTAPELRGTPAAPEPIASNGHFYTDRELAALARTAELRSVTVDNNHGGQLLVARA